MGKAARTGAVVVTCVAMSVGIAAGVVAPAAAGPRATTPADATDVRLLPDLRMAPLTDVHLLVVGGQRQLRFSATIVNAGAGPFELLGSRASTSDAMTVDQHIYHSVDPYEDVTTTATMFYAGDGHDHWHVKNLETYRLIRRRSGAQVGTSLKSGFCFADSVAYNLSLVGAPLSPVWDPSTACSRGQPDSLSVPMGLSVGWGDMYRYTLPDQFIDITGLPLGTYRLVATADDANRFIESNDLNNSTRIDLRVRANSVIVL